MNRHGTTQGIRTTPTTRPEPHDSEYPEQTKTEKSQRLNYAAQAVDGPWGGQNATDLEVDTADALVVPFSPGSSLFPRSIHTPRYAPAPLPEGDNRATLRPPQLADGTTSSENHPPPARRSNQSQHQDSTFKNKVKPYPCPHQGCAKTFTTPYCVNRHFKQKHETSPIDTSTRESQPVNNALASNRNAGYDTAMEEGLDGLDGMRQTSESSISESQDAGDIFPASFDEYSHLQGPNFGDLLNQDFDFDDGSSI